MQTMQSVTASESVSMAVRGSARPGPQHRQSSGVFAGPDTALSCKLTIRIPFLQTTGPDSCQLKTHTQAHTHMHVHMHTHTRSRTRGWNSTSRPGLGETFVIGRCWRDKIQIVSQWDRVFLHPPPTTHTSLLGCLPCLSNFLSTGLHPVKNVISTVLVLLTILGQIMYDHPHYSHTS